MDKAKELKQPLQITPNEVERCRHGLYGVLYTSGEFPEEFSRVGVIVQAGHGMWQEFMLDFGKPGDFIEIGSPCYINRTRTSEHQELQDIISFNLGKRNEVYLFDSYEQFFSWALKNMRKG